MEYLEGPYEILELDDRESIEFHIEKWQLGEMVIKPKYAPQGKTIKALRVFIPKEEKNFFPYYWDVTGQTLVAQLLPILEGNKFKGKVFKITKYGVAPRARFTLEVK